jgi:flagellar biosynthesis anti-sigma factor FlgM
MRINGNNSDPRRTGRSSATGSASQGGQEGGASGKGPDGAAQVDLNLPHLRAKLESLPEVRMSRVEALQKRIDEGEYEVDGEAVVGHMLRNVLLDNLK